MRAVCAVLAAVLLAPSTIASGQRLNGEEEFRQGMKTIGGAMAATQKAIADRHFADAKVPVILARQTLASSAPFWSERKNAAAVAQTKKTVRELDDLDTALSAASPDAVAVDKALATLNESCRTCHAAHRGEQE